MTSHISVPSRQPVGLDLHYGVGNVWSLGNQFLTHRHCDGMAIADAETAVHLYMKVHSELGTDIAGADRVRRLDPIHLEGELLNSPPLGCRRSRVDQLIHCRAEDPPRGL